VKKQIPSIHQHFNGKKFSSHQIRMKIDPPLYKAFVRSIVNAAIFTCAFAPISAHSQTIVNGNFEDFYVGQDANGGGNTDDPDYPNQTFDRHDGIDYPVNGEIPGWLTTALDNTLEVWASGLEGTTGGIVFAANGTSPLTNGGNYFAELNARQASTLYQDILFTTAGLMDYSFLHRGRTGSDTMRFAVINLGLDGVVGGGDDLEEYFRLVTTDNVQDPGEFNGWQHVFGTDIFHSVPGRTYRFEYTAISTSGTLIQGNFIDNAFFELELPAIPEPSSLLMAAFGSLLLLRRRRLH
jgi:hypothetical protein